MILLALCVETKLVVFHFVVCVRDSITNFSCRFLQYWIRSSQSGRATAFNFPSNNKRVSWHLYTTALAISGKQITKLYFSIEFFWKASFSARAHWKCFYRVWSLLLLRSITHESGAHDFKWTCLQHATFFACSTWNNTWHSGLCNEFKRNKKKRRTCVSEI